MNRTFIKSFILFFVIFLSTLPAFQVRADDGELTYPVPFTEEELDNLLAPIALFPDPLLAQMLPASTYPEEVLDAESWLNSGGDPSRIDEQNWAESVRAIARYPGILQMMAANMDWTASVGDAFLNQPEDVADSIQRLRWQARAVGNLVSNAEQLVIVDGDYIQIIPAQPQYVYVPQYDTSVVYVQAPPMGVPPFITFGVVLVIGDWFSMDFDWHRRHVIYHGWNRPGWVDHARPYVHIRNVYITRNRPLINQTWRHDRARGDPDGYLRRRPGGPDVDRHERVGEAGGSTTIRTRPHYGIFDRGSDARTYSNRGKESRGIVNRVPTPPTQGIRQRPATPAPQAGSSVTRRDNDRVQPARTPSVTFGGYRGSAEAREQSLRGQTSRQSNVKEHPSSVPVSKGKTPAGRDSSREDKRRQR